MPSNLRAKQQALEELWKQGLSGHELLQHHTRLVDEFIIKTFTTAEEEKKKGAIALIALGGYGRRELYPFSDVDLLLLHDRKAGKYMQKVAESILYPLWDANFEVGHSVRTIKDAVRFANHDFIFRVSLLDARLLTGDESLFQGLLKKYRKKVLEGQRHSFVRTMDEMRTQRRDKYGSHAFLLEPHIKEGKGGMRDIQAMLWTAKAVFGLSGLAAMEDAGLIEAGEHRSFLSSWNMLAKIRNRLHYISGRHNDQLFFEHQEEMALAFGFQDAPGVLAVEHFMRKLYSDLQTIAVTTDIFFEHVHEVLGLGEKNRKSKPLEKGITACCSTLRMTTSNEELAARPLLLMRLFLQSSRTGLPIHHRSRQLVTRSLQLVDDHFKNSKRVAAIFMEILTRPENGSEVLETMLETGLLPAYIPEFSDVESLAQHDLYHVYTVDRHQLQTVAELSLLRESEAELFQALPEQQLLYLAGLLHDIGKGKQTDHSRLGADMIRLAGKRMGLSQEQQDILSFLVQYHLYLPENALRRDLDDREFIQKTADLMGDTNRLTMLYLLSIADSKATGPSAWSSWKSGLMADLYLKVRACLEAECAQAARNEEITEDEEQGIRWLLEQVEQRLQGDEQTRIAPSELPADYLLSFTPEMVCSHLRLHRDNSSLLQQKVLLFPEKRQGSWSLMMMSRNLPGLLAKLCGVLTLHKLSVLAAQIFTWQDKTVLDVLDVVPMADSGFDEQNWQALEHDLNLAVNYRLDVGLQLHAKLQQSNRRNKKKPVQQLNKKVVIDNSFSSRFTVIEVYGVDRAGTLYQLTQTLSDFQLDIHRARIATEVEQLIDIFYVTTPAGDKIEEPILQKKIKDTLYTIVNNGEE